MSRLWLIPLGGALLGPLVTWLPMLAQRAPGLMLPPYALNEGMDLWHMHVFYLVSFATVAAIVGQQDRWLGVAVLMMGLVIFLWGGTFDLTHRVMFMLGALALWAMRKMPASARPLVIACLAASGVFQAVYVIQQMLGYDVLWIDLWGVHAQAGQRLRALGTLGTEDAAACYIAITAPLMPVWALPLAGAAVLKGNPEGHSLTAAAALLVGLLVRYHRNWKLTTALTTAVTGVAVLAFWKIQRWHIPSTALGRIQIYALGVEDLWKNYALPGIWTHGHWTIGHGEWWPRIGMLQKMLNRQLTGEIFQQAHNDWLQWAYSHGMLGVSILGLWLYDHRRMFVGPVGASLIAASIAAAGFFPFQVVSLSLLILCLVAIATLEPSQEVV